LTKNDRDFKEVFMKNHYICTEKNFALKPNPHEKKHYLTEQLSSDFVFKQSLRRQQQLLEFPDFFIDVAAYPKLHCSPVFVNIATSTSLSMRLLPLRDACK
jgi:hypothetical protein